MQRGDNLDISAELIDARDDSHIWGQQYSRKAADIFALQGDLAKEMTSVLRMRLTGEDEKRMAKSYTANPEAYQDYLKGRYWWNKTDRGGNEQGHRILSAGDRKRPQLTLWLIPAWPIATVQPGKLRFCSPEGGFSESQGGCAESAGNRRHARRSSRVVRDLSKHTMTGTGQERRRNSSEPLNSIQATRPPTDIYGFTLAYLGRFAEEAIAEQKRALELDPLSAVTNWTVGYGILLCAAV